MTNDTTNDTTTNDTTTNDGSRGSLFGRGLLLAVAALCLLGVGLAVELTRIHLLTHTDPGFRSICAVSEQINCETVALSPYSVFAGLPVSVWGLLGYLLMGGFAVWGLTARRLSARWPWGILFALFVVSAAASATMGFISATRIQSMCLFCMGTYGVNVALLVLGAAALWRQRRGPVAALQEDVSLLSGRPALFGGVAAVGLGLALGPILAVPAYWEAPGWSDLAALPHGTDDAGLHWIGAKDPELTIVEYSDYECPYCRVAHREVRQAVERYPDRVRLVHRHFPLDQRCNPLVDRPFHRRACELALAAECAGRQDRFWAMNDAVFSLLEEGGVKADAIDLGALTVKLGLDRTAFDACMKTGQGAGRVNADVQAGLGVGLNSTPTFFVDGKKVKGMISAEILGRLLGEGPGGDADGAR